MSVYEEGNTPEGISDEGASALLSRLEFELHMAIGNALRYLKGGERDAMTTLIVGATRHISKTDHPLRSDGAEQSDEAAAS